MNEYQKFENVLYSYENVNSLLRSYGKSLEDENCNCKIVSEYGLPCYHTLLQRYKNNFLPLLREEDIPDIYFVQNFGINEETNIETIDTKRPKDNFYKYSNLMDMVAPIATEASRNVEIQKLFDNLFIGFESLKTSAYGSPASLSQSGSPVTRQSLFLDHLRKSGAHKKKRDYRCKICGKNGHNSATCPYRKHE